MKTVLVLCIAAILVGCGETPNQAAKAAARERLFVQCMELAAKINTTQRDLANGQDDLHKAIGKCDSVSYYQAKMYH